MRPVGVHLDQRRGPAVERDAEAVEVGPPEAGLRRSVADPDARVRPRPSDRRCRRCRRATRRRRRAASRRAGWRGSASAMPGRFSASSYVGSTTQVPVPRAVAVSVAEVVIAAECRGERRPARGLTTFGRAAAASLRAAATRERAGGAYRSTARASRSTRAWPAVPPTTTSPERVRAGGRDHVRLNATRRKTVDRRGEVDRRHVGRRRGRP